MNEPCTSAYLATATGQPFDLLSRLADASLPRAVAAEIMRLVEAERPCKKAVVVWGLAANGDLQTEPPCPLDPHELALARAATESKTDELLADGSCLALRLPSHADPSAILLLEGGVAADQRRFVVKCRAELETAGQHLRRTLELADLQTSLKRLERSEKLQSALFTIARLAGSDHDLRETLRDVHAIVARLMYAENFYVVRYDAECDSLHFLYFADVVGLEPPSDDVPLGSIERSLPWYVLRDGKPLRGSPEDLRQEISGPLVKAGAHCENWLGVPLLREGHALGAVVVQSYRPGIHFSAEDQALLEFVGSHILIMLERQQSKKDLEQRVHQRTAELAEANHALQRSAETLHAAYAQLKKRVEERTQELHTRNAELEIAYAKLKNAQEQAVLSEKLASIGQLAAGVAHEINNPIGYVNSNLGTLQGYLSKLLGAIDAYATIARKGDVASVSQGEEIRRRSDIDFLAVDAPQLIRESREGIDRVCKIVRDLKDFSRHDRGEAWVRADVHQSLESTLNIVSNQLKYKAQIVKTFGDLPLIECLPSELNQVFLNILMNAGQAIKAQGVITVSTGRVEDKVWIAIGDDGDGIPPDVLPKIFDPFFTTKPVGTGTGLGLAISYGIVTKHHGTIDVTSVPEQGTLMRIDLPIEQPT